MDITKIIGIVLLVLGGLGLAFGGFSYTKDSTKAKIGPIELKLEEKEEVSVPVWASVIAIAVGGVLLVSGRRK